MYAAEAYHTRGAMRHVVGVLQFKSLQIDDLTILDYWVSMIENWADANKELGHCGGKFTVCLLKMTKYLFRTFNAMKEIYIRLVDPTAVHYVPSLKAATKELLKKYAIFGGKSDPEVLTNKWVAHYKGQVDEIPLPDVEAFRLAVGCTKDETIQCFDTIQMLVEAYDHFLVSTTQAPTTENFILLKRKGQFKPRPIY